MPRLSLYRPERGNDFKYIDKSIWEMFQVGGTDVYLHKYLGVSGPSNPKDATPSQPYYEKVDPTNIQDLLFLENRDRKYSPDVYLLRGIYNIQDIDFNLSQFGLFLQNDTIFISFHISDSVEKIGRKLISGDVIELPHLKDEHALNDLAYALKRFYVIEEINRSAEGFSATWYPHLYRAKCKPIVDSQEFKDILDQVANNEAFQGTWNPNTTYFPGDIVIGPDGKKYRVLAEVTGIAPPNSTYYELADQLRDIISTYEREMQITHSILHQAEADTPLSGRDTTTLYTLVRDPDGVPSIVTVDSDAYDASISRQATDADGNPLFDDNGEPVYLGPSASAVFQTAEQSDYEGYLYSGDGIPANGAPMTAGIAFPMNPSVGEFCLRKDYLPFRLFRFNGTKWVKVEDAVRSPLSNFGPSDVGPGAEYEGHGIRNTQKARFYNNPNTDVINGRVVKEKQSLSKALRPTADEE